MKTHFERVVLDDRPGRRVYADPAGPPCRLVRDWWSAERGDDGEAQPTAATVPTSGDITLLWKICTDFGVA